MTIEWFLWAFLSIQSWQSLSPSAAACYCWCLFAVARVAIQAAVVAAEARSRRRRRRQDRDNGHESNSKIGNNTRARASTSCIWRPTAAAVTPPPLANENNDENNDNDDQGRLMAQVLVPTLLIAVVNFANRRGGGGDGEQQQQQLATQIEAVSMALTFLFSSSTSSSSSLGSSSSSAWSICIILVILLVAATAMKRSLGFGMWLESSILVRGPSRPDAIIFVLVTASYYAIIYSKNTITMFLQPLKGVFTEGEWMVIASLSSFCLVQNYYYSHEQKSDHNGIVMVGHVSLILILASTWACLVASQLQKVLLGRIRLVFQQGISSSSRLTIHIMLLVTVFLATVELLFPRPQRHHGSDSATDRPWLFLPRSLVWLMQFLHETEQSPTSRTLIQRQHDASTLSSWPRFYWIVYYVVILVIFIPLAPRGEQQQRQAKSQPQSSFFNGKSKSSKAATTTISMSTVIITRKWFHLVATLLFTPITIYAPQLQSLSLAVALSLLILIEAIRGQVPFLNRFYLQYLDLNKDNVNTVDQVVDDVDASTIDSADAANQQHSKQKSNANTSKSTMRPTTASAGIVVSHMALIVGCATPLWIANAATLSKKQLSSSYFMTSDGDAAADDDVMNVLLGLLGVICLGVGDAVGALVGRFYGRQRAWWGRQGRTLEGSMAMLVSMILFTYALTLALRGIIIADDDKSLDNNSIMTTILPSLIFMTILEAYTTQIDNLILPLAGSAMFLLSLQRQKLRP